MTGYGQARYENEQFSISAEVKTLNSKFLDTIFRLPKTLADKENELRNLLSERLERGKVNTTIELVRLSGNQGLVKINETLFQQYYSQLTAIAQNNHADASEIFKIVLGFPEVVIHNPGDELGEEEWKLIKNVLIEAIDKCDEYRSQEGRELEKKLLYYISSIEMLLQEISDLDPQRIILLREKLQKSLEDLPAKIEADPNRFEQEIIYYIEKLDISEEKVRLKSHLSYFKETLQSADSNGKKLNFIAQEIGREINTIGAKAYHAQIQRLVVNMKDELEKIKEQVLNIL
jgi:uncharacterized protein (TIGR00255 family)